MSEAGSNSGISARSRRRAPRKPKKSQIPYGMVLLIVVIAVGCYLATFSSKAALFWTLGNVLGYVLQKSRFCFTASLRDPYLTGSTSVTRAVLIALAITSIGFTAIKYGAFTKGLPIPGQGYIVPISLATIVGGILFGIGMVIAGGCASGTFMRIGEGFGMQILALFFFIIGSLLGANHFGWWKLNFMLKGPKVFLPDTFGWFGGLTIQLLFIATLYILAKKWEAKKLGEGE